MAGVLVVLAALVRLGRFLAYIPWPVIEGFTVGIALIIFLQQVPAALGVSKPEGENTAVVAVRAVGEALHGNGTLAASGPRGARGRGDGRAPAAPPSPAGVADRRDRRDGGRAGSQGSTWPASAPCPTPCPYRRCRRSSVQRLSDLFGAAFAVAALAAIESLLSAKVADGMADMPRHDPDRELFGQGLANLASPLFGGMPATGAIARTAVNVRAGARTRVAAIVHALGARAGRVLRRAAWWPRSRSPRWPACSWSPRCAWSRSTTSGPCCAPPAATPSC